MDVTLYAADILVSPCFMQQAWPPSARQFLGAASTAHFHQPLGVLTFSTHASWQQPICLSVSGSVMTPIY